MFWFGTPGGDLFSADYIGSVACFDSKGSMIAISKVNPLQIEQENFEPLSLLFIPCHCEAISHVKLRLFAAKRLRVTGINNCDT